MTLSPFVRVFMAAVTARHPAEPEFHWAVQEVAESLDAVLETRQAYRRARIVERLVEPERVLMFRVVWQDDRGEARVTRGYRM